jgi:hypothetical protein
MCTHPSDELDEVIDVSHQVVMLLMLLKSSFLFIGCHWCVCSTLLAIRAIASHARQYDAMHTKLLAHATYGMCGQARTEYDDNT